MAVAVITAVEADLTELADVAARTFPLACPPSATADDVAAFIAANLSEERFRKYLADDERTVLTARDGDRMSGYAML
ncbi:MAG: GNAT family N-acetyltransferase, partial [Mycolicibacterium sp.]|nr:GNAT family N-acetyltransferase [Mycolicibacterium sp.]